MGLGRVEDAWTKCAVRQVCEKYLANGKDVFWAFMDLDMWKEWMITVSPEGC